MIKDIQSDNTTKITINGLTITVNFAEDRNISAENSIGKLLLENLFRKGNDNETSKDSVSQQHIKTMCKVG